MPDSAKAWNDLIAGLPNPHLLQTWQWGAFKAEYGWQPSTYVWERQNGGDVVMEKWTDEKATNRSIVAAALVLERAFKIRGINSGLRVLYVPKGPVLDWQEAALRDQILVDLRHLATGRGAIFIKIDPDIPAGNSDQVLENSISGSTLAELSRQGWIHSPEQVQFRNTFQINLAQTEEDLLAKMKQKTRYNVRLAERKGVRVRNAQGSDLAILYQIYAETALRDDFTIRNEGYYISLWESFIQAEMAEALIAEVDGAPVAGLVIFYFAGCAYYLHGMSRQLHREKMPNYLLQWEAIRRAKSRRCRVYDLWGAPDEIDESYPMWGVYRFKEGLGGEFKRFIGAWDLPVHHLSYSLYTHILPEVLKVMRIRGLALTRESIRSEPSI